METLRSTLGKSVIVAVAALAVVLALNGGVPGTAAEHEHEEPDAAAVTMSPDVDACTLVTSAEAEAALGAAVTAVSDAAQCTYVAGDASGRGLSIAVPASFGAQESAESGMQQVAEILHGELAVLSDVGDEAYAVTSANLAQLMSRQGDHHVAIVLTMPSGSAGEQVATLADLGRTALSRM